MNSSLPSNQNTDPAREATPEQMREAFEWLRNVALLKNCHTGREHAARLMYRLEALERRTRGAVRPVAYECPKYCGCWWRDNFDGTMSLFDGDQKSCKVCEHLPLEKLLTLSVANHAFIDNRGDGRWLVCVGKVHADEHSARKECRRWIAAFSKPTTPSLIGVDMASGPDEMRYSCSQCGLSATPCKHQSPDETPAITEQQLCSALHQLDVDVQCATPPADLARDLFAEAAAMGVAETTAGDKS